MSLLSIFRRLFGLDPPPPVKSCGGLPPLLMLSPVDLRVISPLDSTAPADPAPSSSTDRRTPEVYPRELDSLAPAPSSSMDCLPPEVLIKVLEWLARVERNRNDLLRYRLVSSKWKVLLGPLIEQKIISRELTPFPEIKDVQIGEDGTHPLSVRPNLFRDGVNPFPFNSLHVETAFKKNPGDVLMPFLKIATSWGGYLTSFSSTQAFFIKDLVSILGCMPNLKRLGLPWVIVLDDVTKPTFAFPPPPSLPQLTTLDLKSYSPGWEDTHDSDSDMVLSIWMILSYADQLERLTVWAEYPLPALQRNQNYYHHLDTGARIFIGSTSDSAFGKLTELEISRPDKNFLLSRTPALRRFTVTSSDDRRRSRVNFWRVVEFVDKCRQSLQHISLDVTWPELPIGGPNCLIDLDPKELEPPPSMIALPLVKTLVLTYAAFYEKVIVNKTLDLGKFPALKKLHLLRFRADVYEPERDQEILLGRVYEALVTETVGYPPLIVSRIRSLRVLINGVRTRIDNNMAIVEEQRREMVISHKRMFEALRENDEENSEDIGRKLFEREGIWKSCPKLKDVSISSNGWSDGDVCIIRRLED